MYDSIGKILSLISTIASILHTNKNITDKSIELAQYMNNYANEYANEANASLHNELYSVREQLSDATSSAEHYRSRMENAEATYKEPLKKALAEVLKNRGAKPYADLRYQSNNDHQFLIRVIKSVREEFGPLSLRDSKNLVEQAIKDWQQQEDLNALRAKLTGDPWDTLK